MVTGARAPGRERFTTQWCQRDAVAAMSRCHGEPVDAGYRADDRRAIEWQAVLDAVPGPVVADIILMALRTHADRLAV